MTLLRECAAKRPYPAEFYDDQYFSSAYLGASGDLSGPGRKARKTSGRRFADESVPRCDAGEVELLRRMFAPSFYARSVELGADDADKLWEHYLARGLTAGIPITPLFDADCYCEQIVQHGLPELRPGEPPLLHWLRVGRAAGVVPSRNFDDRFYRATYSDLAELEESTFLHYVTDGIHEGRAPTVWFDPVWYQGRSGGDSAARYDDFIATGLHAGRLPGELTFHMMRKFGGGTRFTSEIYAALMAASAAWDGPVPSRSILLLMALYVPQWHAPAASPLDGFLHYLANGLPAGLPPGPLFDEAAYRRRAAAGGLPAFEPGDTAVLHWMRFGAAQWIVPSERFDEAFYRSMNPDIDHDWMWGFEHFVNHGVHEGRAATTEPMFRRPEAPPGADAGTLPSLYRQWYALDFLDDANVGRGEVPAAADAHLQRFLRSDALAAIFAQAQAIEPNVGELGSINDFLLPPFHDSMAPRHAALRSRLPQTHYDTIICVPWVRVGGADLVAALLARSLLRVRPHETILVLRTDQPHFERADWFPDGIDVVCISDLLDGIATSYAEELLRTAYRGVTARRVFNVNSRLCWTTMRTHGRNLAATLRSYAYLFCWDLTPSGLRAGYPAEFYPETAETVVAFLTDTQYLKDELVAMYRLPQIMSDRIVPLHTPAQTPVQTPSVARTVQDTGDPSSRKLVLWAGRLDRQKRFDLVQAIARLMPDVEFRCWGAPLLDQAPDLAALPPNVTMQGHFNSFDDLPLAAAGVWLFTALWEGMPTTIIELAVRGVAIVASAVGGVPELIRPDTGWPVPADAEAQTYAAAIQAALDSPEEATRRAEALQVRVAATYGTDVYDAMLTKLLAAEDAL